MKNSAIQSGRPGGGDAGHAAVCWRVRAWFPFGAAIVLGVALGGAHAARAENECGRPDAGPPILCSPSNYDAATDGNIVYRLGKANGGEFSVRLADDLSIRYDRHDPDDDQLVFPVSGAPLYSAVRIETDADHAGDISFLSSADVTSNGRGVSVAHNGRSGALRTEVSGGFFSIASEWLRAYAIHSYRGDGYDTGQEFSGDHDLIVRDVVVDVDGGWAAIVGSQGGEGDLNIAVRDSDIKVDAPWATGVFASHRDTGDVDIDIRNVDIDAGGTMSVDGFLGYHLGSGKTDIVVRDSTISVKTAETRSGNGIAFLYSGGEGGDLSFDVRDVEIDVSSSLGSYRTHDNEDGGRYFDGIWGGYWGEEGDIHVDVRHADIAIEGADSGGMSFIHDRKGDIDITARDVDIRIEGDRSVGIGGGQRHEGTGDIAIDVRDSTVVATGEAVAGIRAFNFTGEGSIDIRVDGGTITAEGKDSSGILVGLTGRLFDDRPEPIGAPAQRNVTVNASDNTRRTTAAQNVAVNGRVRGDSGVGAGVRLYGGGRVHIGPRGSVGATSGVAVRAEAVEAALHVGAQLDGRRLSDAIAGEIRNDDGRTTVEVNGVVLHDGITGATGRRAPNGARDISLAASETVAGRAFRPTDFVTAHAPRAAVYEALPGFMLRLDSREEVGKRLRMPGSPAWVSVSGGQGSYAPDRSSVGATYDFGRLEAEAGVDFAFSGEGALTGWASLRHVRGSADVSAPTGGGKIDAEGFGASFGASWEHAAGYHASGRISVARYETDLRADGRGLLKEGAGVTVRTLGVEAGRRFSLADDLSLVPQAWLTCSDVSADGFRDDVGSQVSAGQTDRSIAGVGIVTETVHSWNGSEEKLVLRGRLGVERVLGDAGTVVDVSGERLGSEAARTRGVLGLGAAYRWNRWSLGGEVSAAGLGSDDSGYAASLRIGMQF